jgi:uncharacterized protein
MIVSFSVSNFRSFSGEETLSLVASNRLSGSHDDHAIPIPDSKERVLRAAVLYGANGAGKSNLFKALRYLKSAALDTRPKGSGTGRDPCLFAGPPDAPSSFDVQFIATGRLYRFGLKADDQRITDEWLFRVVGNRQKLLYERTTDENGKVTVNAEGLKDAGEKVISLAKVGGPQNRSFLATANSTLDERESGEDLLRVLRWFRWDLNAISPDESLGSLAHAIEKDTDFRRDAGAFLKSTSTGVSDLEVVDKEISKDVLAGSLTPEREGVWSKVADGKERLAKDGHSYQSDIFAVHEHEPGKVFKLELAEESDGTRRLLTLYPALHRLRTAGAVYVIDEIDRSLHPILVREFLEFFLKAHAGSPGQIIVTTHESNLLDQDLLRRDEIWFAEKDHTGATRLYSLLDFKVRNDLEIRKHYLQGRFGAVPFLGNLENLAAKTDRHE